MSSKKGGSGGKGASGGSKSASSVGGIIGVSTSGPKAGGAFASAQAKGGISHPVIGPAMSATQS